MVRPDQWQLQYDFGIAVQQFRNQELPNAGQQFHGELRLGITVDSFQVGLISVTDTLEIFVEANRR